MFGRNDVSDRDLLKTINQKLARTGSSQSKVTALVQRGTVTLSGSIYFENQRMPMVKAAHSVAGVRTVVDQMKLAPKKTY